MKALTTIVTYHSISDGPGPTCIPVETFRRQLETLEACGYRGTSLRELLDAPPTEAADRRIVLTFDDGYEDFASVVFPEIADRGWSCTVFVSAGKAGGHEDWPVRGHPLARPLMGWEALAAAARAGMEIGAHGMTHADLTRLRPERLREEIAGSRRILEERIGRRIETFAYPYGRSDHAVREETRRHYRAAVGTVMGRVGVTSDRYDLPRIDMWYFRDSSRWRRHLERGPGPYYHARRLLRGLRVFAERLRGFSVVRHRPSREEARP